MTVELDPDIARFQTETNADYALYSGGAYADVHARRAVAERVRERWAQGGPAMATTETLTAGPAGVRVRIHRPTDGENLPILTYLHGGGWVLFSLDSHDRLMREYAARSGCAVVGVDYSRSPEVRFPTALDEIGAVCDWLREHGPEHGLDPSRMTIGGDSAGGNLALSSAIRQRDLGTRLDGMLLNYGAFDTVRRDSHGRYDGAAYMLTCEEMVDFWDNYFGTVPGVAENSLARPMLAELDGLPPAFLCIAECDILADENRAMATRLREAGVVVTEKVYRGASHSFLEAVDISALAGRAIEDGAVWLARTLRR